jgi:hypothetical protein
LGKRLLFKIEVINIKEFSINKNKQFLLKRMGNMSQLASVKKYELTDGKAKGVEAVDIKTGTGFQFTVLTSRGMDIAWCEYKGIPLSYISKNGIVSPFCYENEGMNWLRSFFAGMLTTCGLSNVGGPCEEDHPVIGKVHYGLHGRISNTEAGNVCVVEEWNGDDFELSVSGQMRESVLHGENLTLKRSIKTKLGQDSFIISDVIENQGFAEVPLMLLYHINIGYPVLDEGSRFVSNSKSIQPADQLAMDNLNDYSLMQEPENGRKENCYFHELNSDQKGDTYVGLINDKLEIGVYVKFNKNQLPKLTEWKMLSEAEYVFGIEPANCYPVGRVKQREMGDLQMIKPGEQKKIELEIGVLTGLNQILEFESKVKLLGINSKGNQ